MCKLLLNIPRLVDPMDAGWRRCLWSCQIWMPLSRRGCVHITCAAKRKQHCQTHPFAFFNGAHCFKHKILLCCYNFCLTISLNRNHLWWCNVVVAFQRSFTLSLCRGTTMQPAVQWHHDISATWQLSYQQHLSIFQNSATQLHWFTQINKLVEKDTVHTWWVWRTCALKVSSPYTFCAFHISCVQNTP